MRRILSTAIVAAAVAALFAVRAGGVQSSGARPASGGKRLIDLKSDDAGPVAPGDSAIFLVGNFAAQHNGAVITCDSAVRYSDMRIGFFGNVLINKNTTYIYGDRAEYDGTVNEARIFSDIVKVVDGDATLYTYDFVFNTKENVGRFDGGGVLVNRDNRLETRRGLYYADTKELVCVRDVEMRNDEYELKGDSVIYNMGTDNAYFFDRTNIWNRDGDYLYADRGAYRKADTLYIIRSNGYILTPKYELWSDSVDYYRERSHAILRHDIQIDDTEHKTLAFGDYGEYWKEPGDALLTRRPSIVGYDLSQAPDTVYMRSDTIWLFTILPGRDPATAGRPVRRPAAAADSMAEAVAAGIAGGEKEVPSAADTLRRGVGKVRPADGGGRAAVPAADSVSLPGGGASGVPADSLAADSLGKGLPAADSLAADTVRLTPAERKALKREEARKEKAARKAAKAKARKEKLDEIAAERRAKNNARLDAQKEREERREAARKARALARLKARQARAARKGKPIPVDSVLMGLKPAAEAADSLASDSLAAADTSAVATDAPAADSLGTDSLPAADTMYRLVKGFRDVKIYRTDFQVVCDSMTAVSRDSTMHLYVDPVLWNDNNQITSDSMDIYTARRQLLRAEFVGSPMMASMIDTTHYNQIAGKKMTAHFRDNEIYRNDVDVNAQTLYYMEDGEPKVITMMGVIESGSITFYIEEKQVVRMAWRTDPDYHFYPIDQVPADQELYLKGFKWEGARRPMSKEEVFDRRIRPSERAVRSRLDHPDFPIMQRLEEFKRRLVEERRWTDRNDRVDPLTVEWMRDLGYEVGQPRAGRSEVR